MAEVSTGKRVCEKSAAKKVDGKAFEDIVAPSDRKAEFVQTHRRQRSRVIAHQQSLMAGDRFVEANHVEAISEAALEVDLQIGVNVIRGITLTTLPL